jgi:esterase/lipase
MDEEYVLHPPTYEWTVRLFSRLRKMLGINIKLHGDPALLAQGEIFLFNHFARIETFLPHYLIYQETGAFCRCIATKALFKGNESFRKYLSRVGVIPNDHEELLPMLVAEIMRGRKVVIFPEGGMIKDRRVLDEKGKFRIYSRKAMAYRKHHAGAAVLATAVDTFKLAVLTAEKRQDWGRIDSWVEMLEIKNREHLLFAARRPTRIIPGNITFYPINTGDNFLNKSASLFNTELNPKVNEELIIEANLLLKHTDMDMRLGSPVYLADGRHWWERRLQDYLARNLETVEDFFTLKGLNKPWVEKIIRRSIRHSSEKLRDRYMEGIYKEVTVNLSHLASTIVLNLLDKNVDEIEVKRFYLIVYLAVKHIQEQPNVHLHRSLRNPEVYADLVVGRKKVLKQFLDMSVENGLIELKQGRLILLQKLNDDFELDSVRIENTIQVYANEMAPVVDAVTAVNRALSEYETISDTVLASYHYDDELRCYDWNHHYYSKPRFDDINRDESATESGRPFLVLPEGSQRDIGIVLVHGFLASPAEMKPLSDKLAAAGYPVYGVRLPGHGTSPADLRERSWEDWLRIVQRGYETLGTHVDKVCLVGFSTGGALSLIFASEHPPSLAGVVAINPPVKFQNKNMKYVPLLHGVSRLVRWVSSFEDVMPYRSSNPEHVRINYRSIPVRGLYELVRMNHVLNHQLNTIRCPCLLVRSSNDPIVAADSSQILQQGLVNADVSIVEIESDRHGILYEDKGDTHKIVMQYIQQLLDPSIPERHLQEQVQKRAS